MAQRLKTDWILFVTTVVLVCFGLVMVYSASSIVAELKFHSSAYFLYRQVFWAALSFFALMYFKRKHYKLLETPTWAFAPLGAVLTLLVLVYFLDAKQHRWLRAGPLSLQPSEFAKPALIIFLAWFVTHRLKAINTRHTLLPATVTVSAVGLMVVIADLGTAVVLVLTAATVFFIAGLEAKYMAIAACVGVLLAGVAVISKPYRLARIIGYVDPNYELLDRIDTNGVIKSYAHRSLSTRDPSYQVRQSKIAVGSGGPLGLGLMRGQQKLLYLPEAHTDFIYAVVGEELGLWGSTALVLGFVLILWRGLRLFWLAPDDFGRYLALGVTVSVVAQAFINMSVVLDLAPTKGIPLPMISSGGSSLLSTLMSLGILLSVSEHSG
jgi:cell division protein FtsW